MFGFFPPSFLLPHQYLMGILNIKPELFTVRFNFSLGDHQELLIYTKCVGFPQATCVREELVSENCYNIPARSHLNTAFAWFLRQNV